MAPRGLKAFVQKAPGKLCRGRFKGYRATDANGKYDGPTLSGITKRLSERLYTQCDLEPHVPQASVTWVPPSWRGHDGGMRRGRAVDSQVSRLAGVSAQARKGASKLKYTNFAFSALEIAGLEPLVGQRVVLDRQMGIATAADMICYDAKKNALVVVELKCGYNGSRTEPARKRNKPQTMAAPCATATDCLLHRHTAQLAATHALLVGEAGFLKELKKKFGVASVRGALLYVNDEATELHDLPGWWTKRGKALLRMLAA